MVLVTGASGFLGRNLVQYLSAQGVPARALYHRHAPSDELKRLAGIEWISCDLLDVFAVEQAMAGITEVYHCAAIVSFSSRKRDEMLRVNPESTANIVNQSLEQGIRKMVYVSSVAAIGRTGEAKIITEEEEWGESTYNSAYGMSKYLAENEVWRGIGEGLNAVIVNPGILLGHSTGHELAFKMIQLAWREFPFYSKGIASFVDVEDVVKILVTLMHSDIHSERFIVSGENTTFREIFTLMAKALDKRPPRWHGGRFMTGIAWRLSALQGLLSGKGSLITRETVNNANAISLYDNSKLLKALPGFSYTPINHAIEIMARSFMDLDKK